jgi:GTP-binding protein EngB required for normal cell division
LILADIIYVFLEGKKMKISFFTKVSAALLIMIMIVLTSVRGQVNTEYNKYAPLGSKLTQLQRQVNIYEQEYLQAITNLNQAKIKQNNITVSNSVDIVDYPIRPTEPEPSKKALYVILSFIVTFLILSFVVLVIVFLDNSIRTPQRAEEILNINVLGAIPKINKKIKKNIIDKLMLQIVSKIRLIKNGNRFVTIAVLSLHEKEGKTTFIKTLKKYLNEDELKNIKFEEHPPLTSGELLFENLTTSIIQVLIIDANKELTEADKYHINRFKEVAMNRYIVLNNIKKISLDSIL